MKNLHLFDLDSVDHIIAPEYFEKTTLASSAKSIFTDFKQFEALVVEGDTPAIDVLNLMIKSHVKMKIVVSKNNDFLGIISTKELTEQHIIAAVTKGTERHEVLVSDLMLPKESLHAFDYNEVETAQVTDIVKSLKNYNLQHCLVLDREQHHIRGVISSSDVARKLQLPIPIDIHAKTSFSDIFNVIYPRHLKMQNTGGISNVFR
ncbi:histidine kinase [Colwellia sp. MSW7]|uniref:Histidine kinase n=1 Tax=Colwellia maritima TaxID=2912588 RepID=A0ABS9X5R6_9GAMM|nr:CBS domain-containing protein [Colwellia maritima]MCI2285571.1 histidine kinase [Colwellia maritima]